jgi:TolB-like protein
MDRWQHFISELKRRRVLHSLMIWGIVAFAVLQVYEPVMHGLHLPEWTLSFVVVLLGFGFPVTAALSWLFDIKWSGIGRARQDVADGDGFPVSPRLHGVRLVALLLGLGLAAATPGLVYFFVWPGAGRHAARDSAASSSASAGLSIAVLPLADMSPQRDQGYLADGVAEEIQNALGQVEGLHVTGRTFSLSFNGTTNDLRSIGQTLKVDAVISGSVRKEGDQVRISVAMANVADGYLAWSRTFDRDAPKVLAVEEEIAAAVVEVVGTQLLRGRVSQPERKPSHKIVRQPLAGHK